jgi:hypothetical protein
VRQSPRACAMRKRLYFNVAHIILLSIYMPFRTQGSRDRHGWIRQAAGLLLWRGRAQTFLRAD